MKRSKLKTIKAAICVDPMGHGFGEVSAEDEIDQMVRRFRENYGFELDWYRIYCVSDSQIKPATKLILFDFGGMLPGNSLMEDNSRALIRWAENHPNSLCLIMSHFTWRNGVGIEMEDLGLTLPNVIENENWAPLPEWFVGAL